MNKQWGLLIFLAITVTSIAPAFGQPSQREQDIQALPWRSYPERGAIGSIATIGLTNDLRFLDEKSTSRFLELNGNPPRQNDYALESRSQGWFAVFSFDSSGYVRDDEKIDPDDLLRKLKEQNQASIEERKRLNLPVLHLEGWVVAPHYDSQTRRLEWGTKLLDDDGRVIVNYTIRLLGRSGVMKAILVSDPPSLDRDVESFRNALTNYDFVPGQRYSEFRQGDHVAEYGLAALIVGGAAAAAAKSGAFKGLFKIVGVAAIAAFAAVVAFLRGLAKKIFKRNG